MSVILSIETSAASCSACIASDGELINSRIQSEGRGHSELLGVFIDELITEAEAKGLKLDAVAVSAGPGSYTGLRIGVSTAKGLCFGYDIPLIAIPTLQLIAHTAQIQSGLAGMYVPMIDARRMEVYTATYNCLTATTSEIALVVDELAFEEELKNTTMIFCGDGAGKCMKVIQSDKAIFLPNVIATADYMIPLAQQAFDKKQFVDLAYFEPNYLKAFQTTKSTKNPLA